METKKTTAWKYRLMACHCISDQWRYYEKMARKGMVLKKSTFFADKFEIGEPQELSYYLMPLNYDLAKDHPEWRFVTENRYYDIYTGRGKKRLEEIDAGRYFGRCFAYALCGVLVPVLLVQLMKSRLFLASGWLAVFTMLFTLLLEVGLFTAAVIPASEIFYWFRKKEFYKESDRRFQICEALTKFFNVCQIIAVVLILLCII